MKTIFVVDDTASVRDVCYEFLKKDYHVFAMNNEIMVKNLFPTHMPDLVLTDNDMPFPDDGVRLARWIKDNHPAIPVILMSGGEEPDSHRADKFFKKPPNWVLLMQTIAELIAVASR